jgi:hypothetical protein
MEHTPLQVSIQMGLYQAAQVLNSDAKVANRNVSDFGIDRAHAAVSRRPPMSLDSIVARTHIYTYAAKYVVC